MSCALPFVFNTGVIPSMQRLISTTIAMMALSSTILVSGNLPVIGQFAQPAIAQMAAAKKPIQLNLAQFKKVPDKKGFKLVSANRVNPGDIIVYRIAASNISTRSINNLVVNQKIRPGTTYVLNSATPARGAELTYSIDGGRTYASQPMLGKKPAAANNYTNVRWAFTGGVAPKSQSNLSYEVRIR
jgi:uncharacterized repeat protein (TIGR01451 family)